MARVIISAGHTNDQPGTIANGIREVDLTRKIAGEVIKELRKEEIITLSVPPNLDLARRISWINQTGYTEEDGDIAIEIHINEGGKSGVEGWHQADKNNSIELTKAICERIKTDLGWEIQGVKSEYEHELGSLAFLHNTNPISSLIECGYIDNEEDLKILKSDDGLKKLAGSIAKGILKYLGKAVKPSTNTSVTQPISSTPQPPPAAAAQQPPIDTNQPTAYNPPVSQYAPPQNNPYASSGGYNPPANIGMGAQGFGGGIQAGAGAGGGYMNREERKDMIRNNYVKILGREPNQADLNYFLNLGTSEEQLIKRMIDSQEHADLVKARQEVIKTKETLSKHTTDILYLRTKVTDQQGIIKNLNQLLIQKNRAIYQLNLALRGFRQQNPPQTKPRKIKYKKTFSEKFLDYFSNKLGS
ncbi:N-acetylmuramoyl-L-alanine amidase [Candidatus Dojkabacteria bacterium]|nr:N-acetylmuramoyl-L-alanine amidase [Candidatus Dojkabacteria bacterium]